MKGINQEKKLKAHLALSEKYQTPKNNKFYNRLDSSSL